MSITFHRVRWKNFLSTGNNFSEIDLDSHNTTLVVGANGHGKSTFMDAICYALYNKSFRKINKPQLINSINGKNCLVEIEFTTGKDTYMVRRGMKPAVFEIFKNGDIVNQDAANRDYQEILEKYILKLTYKSFCQVVILGSASFIPFMQLTTGQRREIIEDLLDIQIFTTMNMLLKDKVSSNQRDILEADYRHDLASEKIKMHEDHMRSVLSNSKDIIDECESKIAKHEEDVASENRIVAELLAEQKGLLRTTSSYETLSKKLGEMGTLRNKIGDRIDRLNDDITFFKDHDDCPTCKQLIDATFKSGVVHSKVLELEEVRTGYDSMVEKYTEAERKVEEMKGILDRISSINIDVNLKTNRIKHIEESIADLKDQIAKVNDRSISYVSDDETLRKLEDELLDVDESRKNLIEMKEIHKVTARILKDDGIKARIIKQYIPVINKLINKYLAAMDFFVQFELDENFNETIKSRFRDVFSYQSFSEGEKTRIDLALLFAWRTVAKLRNSASTNLLILDEVFDGSLDSTGSEDFLNILYSISGEANIFVISHKTDQMKDKFDKVIEFEKRNNFSSIVNGDDEN